MNDSPAEKARRYETIELWLRQALSPKHFDDIALSDKLGKWVTGGDAIADMLNKEPRFAADGLALLPGDIPLGPLVRDLLIAILNDYLRRHRKIR